MAQTPFQQYGGEEMKIHDSSNSSPFKQMKTVVMDAIQHPKSNKALGIWYVTFSILYLKKSVIFF